MRRSKHGSGNRRAAARCFSTAKRLIQAADDAGHSHFQTFAPD